MGANATCCVSSRSTNCCAGSDALHGASDVPLLYAPGEDADNDDEYDDDDESCSGSGGNSAEAERHRSISSLLLPSLLLKASSLSVTVRGAPALPLPPPPLLLLLLVPLELSTVSRATHLTLAPYLHDRSPNFMRIEQVSLLLLRLRFLRRTDARTHHSAR